MVRPSQPWYDRVNLRDGVRKPPSERGPRESLWYEIITNPKQVIIGLAIQINARAITCVNQTPAFEDNVGGQFSHPIRVELNTNLQGGLVQFPLACLMSPKVGSQGGLSSVLHPQPDIEVGLLHFRHGELLHHHVLVVSFHRGHSGMCYDVMDDTERVGASVNQIPEEHHPIVFCEGQALAQLEHCLVKSVNIAHHPTLDLRPKPAAIFPPTLGFSCPLPPVKKKLRPYLTKRERWKRAKKRTAFNRTRRRWIKGGEDEPHPMPLLAQWTRQRPWLAAGLTGAASGVVGLAGGLATVASAVGAMAFGGISTRATTHEHPLRRRILSTLEARPGLCYRELQTVMNTANGTLRHHLDVLQTRRAVTSCRSMGGLLFCRWTQPVEVLRSKVVGEERMAQQLPIGLSPVQRMILENIDREGVPRSQLNWHEGLVAPEPPFTAR